MFVAPVRFPAHQQRTYVKNRGATVEDQLDELRPPTRRLRAIVQIDHQSLDTRETPASLLPPALQAVHHEVTRQTSRPEQDGQQTPHDLQDSKGAQRRLS